MSPITRGAAAVPRPRPQAASGTASPQRPPCATSKTARWLSRATSGTASPQWRSAWCGAVVLAAALLIPSAAPAQTPANPPTDMSIAITPGLSTSTTSLPFGWTTILVTIANNSGSPTRGEIHATDRQFGNKSSFEAQAPYAVPAGASVSVKVPVNVYPYGQISVRVVDAQRGEIALAGFSATEPSSVVLFDTSGSQLKGAINETPVVTTFEDVTRGSRGGGSAVTVGVALPRVDAATGDPVLPDRAALYDAVDAVLMRSETLVRLPSAELSALAGFVLAGGTLAITITRPEDVRSPTIAAFAGGEVAQASVSSEALRPLLLPTPTSAASGSRTVPYSAVPGEDLGHSLAGFRGGNLHGSAYGNSAPYGLGEVHLLAFDPTRKPALEDGWAKVRMIDLTRRAYDRRANVVFRPGAHEETYSLQKVRKLLDPNESSRWAIAAAAVLLLAYAVLAGPLNYVMASRKNKPLAALRRLPIFSAITFLIIVGIGMVAKGLNGRARHLSLVDAGAGMTKASIRRYRGFFASRAKELTVRTTDASSVVRTAIVSEPGEAEDKLVVDREGARLENVNALPWQTLVMREDGIVSLGDGIAIVKKDAGAVVKNRSGHDLRAAILRLPGGDVRYFAKIADGEAVESTAGRDVGSRPRDRAWITSINTSHPAGTVMVHGLDGYNIGSIVDDDAPGLGDAWLALEEAAERDCAWFVDDVPVLVGQLDGGEGKTSDSSLRLESDRLLVRVVGYGGAP